MQQTHFCLPPPFRSSRNTVTQCYHHNCLTITLITLLIVTLIMPSHGNPSYDRHPTSAIPPRPSHDRKALAKEMASPKEELLEAASAGDADAVAALLADGGNANCRKDDKKRPLHHAAAGGHEKVRAAVQLQ